MTCAFTLLFSRSSSFALFALSDSAKGLSENSGNTAEMKAMLLPSGDHTGCAASVEIVVSLCASPPSAGITHT